MHCISCNKAIYSRHPTSEDVMCGPCALVPNDYGDDVKSKSAVKRNLKKDLVKQEPRREYEEFYPMLTIKSNFARNRTVLLGGGTASLHFNAEGIATTPAHNRELVKVLQRARPGRFTIVGGDAVATSPVATTPNSVTRVAGGGASVEGTQGGTVTGGTNTTTTGTTAAVDGGDTIGASADTGATEATATGNDGDETVKATTGKAPTARQRRLAKVAAEAQAKKASNGGAGSKNKSVEKST
jgi:hypothetical protein